MRGSEFMEYQQYDSPVNNNNNMKIEIMHSV